MSLKKRIYKLTHWEFWPVYMFYLPNAYYALYYAFVEKSLTFYTLTNPGIFNGGIGTESKFKTQQLIPEHFVPNSVFHKKDNEIEHTLNSLKEKDLNFPIIVKPDIGFRGLLVKKINNENELVAYLKNKNIDFILQEYIDYKHECGIFFIRHPKDRTGKITSITLKQCPEVKGNGTNNIRELIESDRHLRLFAKQIEELTKVDMTLIPRKDEIVVLSTIGNHAKGTKFINGNHLISTELTDTINNLNHKIKGWYYGRLDIKYNTWKDVERGNFKIIELNGILGEPTHIYDTQDLNYWKVLKIFRQHWKDLYLIAAYNHQLGIPYKKARMFVNDLKALRKYSKKVKKLI